MMKLSLLMLGAVALVRGQRPSFAGSKPIGYPEVHATTDGLGDRFGEVDGTTQRLPAEANGDRELIDRLSKLPIDKQPFWFINWQALEAHRQNPQTYPQKPNVFVDPPKHNQNFTVSNPSSSSGNNPSSVNSGSVNAQNSITTSTNNPIVNTVTRNSFSNVNSNNIANANFNAANRNTVPIPTSTEPTSDLGNRFGGIELNTYRPENDPIHLDVVNSYFKPGNAGNSNSKHVAPKRLG